MSDKLFNLLADGLAALTTTMINSFFVMWFWNEGLVGAVDGAHPIDFLKALMIYMLVWCLFQPLFKAYVIEKA